MNNQENIAIEAATDGACSGNPGNGGWGGLILFDDGTEMEIGGSEKNTTNNRMELTAAIKTLEKLKNYKLKENFKLRTDSKYVIEGYKNWIRNWKKNGWKTSGGKPVQNTDLWKKIDILRIKGLDMEFVKGHSGDPNNERVDAIATKFSKSRLIDNKEDEISYTLENEVVKEATSSIKKLYSCIQFIDEFAKNGYLLKDNEISDLLSKDMSLSIQKKTQFEWRNWYIIPCDKNYWKIVRKS